MNEAVMISIDCDGCGESFTSSCEDVDLCPDCDAIEKRRRFNAAIAETEEGD